MCGVAGTWGRADVELVREMTERLAHRGPDAEGRHVDDAAALGHRRLSIIDLEQGDQPLYNEDRSSAIIANGEIYNYAALRRELARRHSFDTRSDSETVLHLYEDEGPDAVRALRGMFAFAIVSDDELFLARDPIGIKPLYYGRRDGDLVFASELKALAGLADSVEEFPPGTWYRPDVGFRRYYTVPENGGPEPSERAAIAGVRERLEQAVARRLVSDVPVGAYLSGGLDSSLIAAIARRRVDELHTFSVGVEGSEDLEAARTVARHLDTVHHEYVMTREAIAEALPKIVYYLESFDQDLVRSAIPCHFVSRLAAEHVKVVLTGEGADELFAGYEYYRSIRDDRELGRELRRSVGSLHNINLQRVDRLTMAHSIEGRVPFLDVDLIDFAQRIPVDLKLRENPGGRRVEKWVLRKACEDLLPSEILWRTKEQFDEGSGTLDVLPELLERWLSPADARGHADEHPGTRLRSAEECVYHKLLLDAYDEPDAILANVARWADRPTGR